MTKSNSHIVLSMVFVVLLTVTIGFFKNNDRFPVFDEHLYLSVAHSVYQHDVYGISKDTEVAPPPTGSVGPVYPVFLAAMMHADTGFADKITCFLQNPKTARDVCTSDYGLVKYVQLLLAGISMAAIWFAAHTVSRSWAVASLATVAVFATGAPLRFANHFLTEAVYLPVLFVYFAVVLQALKKPSVARFAIAGVLLAIAGLTRPSFYYYFFISLAALPVCVLFFAQLKANPKRLALPVLAYILGFALLSGAWITRNAIVMGAPSISVGYGALGLAQRVAYNDITAQEYAAGLVYWLPDFGDTLAIKLFGPESIERLRFESNTGFYRAGRAAVIQEADAATGGNINAFGEGEGPSPQTWLIQEKVLGDPVRHTATTLLLSWRGLFVEKYFGLAGLVFGVWALIWGLRGERRRDFLIILFPGMVMLFFNAAISISIPRYNLPLQLPMGIAIALGLVHIFQGARERLVWTFNRLRSN